MKIYFIKMKRLLFYIISCLGIVLPGVCSGQDEIEPEQWDQSTQVNEKMVDAYIAAMELFGKAAKYLEDGQYDQAFQIVQKIEEPSFKIMVLTGLADKCREKDKVSHMLSYALQVAHTIDDIFTKYQELIGIANKYVEIGQYDQALQIANTIDNIPFEGATTIIVNGKHIRVGQYDEDFPRLIDYSSAKAQVLSAISVKYAKDNQMDKALETLSQVLHESYTIKDTFIKSRVLAEIAEKYLEIGQNEQALQIAQMIENSSKKTRVFVRISDEYVKTGQSSRASGVLSQAFQVARTIEDDKEDVPVKTILLAEIARKHVRIGQSEQAIQITQTIEDGFVRANVLSEIAENHIETGQYGQALQVADTIKDVDIKARVLAKVAEKYVEKEQYDQVLQIVKKIEKPWFKTMVLTWLVDKYHGKDKGSDTLFQILQVTRTIEDLSLKNRMFEYITNKYAEFGEVNEQTKNLMNEIKIELKNPN